MAKLIEAFAFRKFTACFYHKWLIKEFDVLGELHIIQAQFGSGSLIIIWSICLYNCNLNLVILQGKLNNQRYQVQVLERAIVPHFDDHSLISHLIFMDDDD